jgi:hypothetical protein
MTFGSHVRLLLTAAPPTESTIVAILVNVVVLFCLNFTVGILGLWQLWYVSRNVTTIESYENAKIDELKCKVKFLTTGKDTGRQIISL